MPRLFFIAALFFSLAGNSVAQTSSPDWSPVLTLESALEQAQRNNRLIAISRQSVLFANDEILAARTQRYPHFNVELRGSSLLTAVDIHIPPGVFGNVGNTPVPSTNSIITTEPKFSALNLIQVVQPLSKLYDAHLTFKGDLYDWGYKRHLLDEKHNVAARTRPLLHFVLDLKIVTWGKVEAPQAAPIPLNPKGELT
jgi:hypothetical protein